MATKNNVAIIGAGFSGLLCAYHILKADRSDLQISLIDPQTEPGRGIAYATPYDFHLLNVPAAKMSCLPDDPEHFLKWCRQNLCATKATDFIARRYYGTYIQSVFAEQLKAVLNTSFQYLCTTVTKLSKQNDGTGFTIQLANNSKLNADYVVLAMGHGQAKQIPGQQIISEQDKFRLVNSWDTDAMQSIKTDERVLIIGNGLTMLDSALFFKSRNHATTLTAISRRGLIPASHALSPILTASSTFNDFFEKSDCLLSLLHKANKLRRSNNIDWRSVIDSLRPETARIWQSASQHERRAFLRHLLPYWDVHRHRAAQQIIQSIEQMIAANMLNVKAARIVSISSIADCLQVELCGRGTNATSFHTFDRIVSCLGPENDVSKWDMPLMHSLLANRLVQPDLLKLGLKTSEHAMALDNNDQPISGIYIIGPARKADLWESIAVPELRVQAQQVAEMILNKCSSIDF